MPDPQRTQAGPGAGGGQQHGAGANEPRLSFDPTNIQATVARLARQVLGNVASTAFEPCGTGGCRAMSMGFTCADCGKPVCNTHGFATLSLKPEIVCVECVALGAPVGAGGIGDAVRGVKKKRRRK